MFLDIRPVVADDNRNIYNVGIEKLIKSGKVHIYKGQRDIHQERVKELAKHFLHASSDVIQFRGNLLLCQLLFDRWPTSIQSIRTTFGIRC